MSIFVKNIETGMVYPIKHFQLQPIKEKKNFLFMWEYPSIPMGKYKPYVVAKFYAANYNLISQSMQYWGNSSSSKIYILLKN
jgi:hypothetical protein